jgi:SAM-dependent methyltransferase
MVLPPGTILQRIFFKGRLRVLNPSGSFFYDVGAGRGELSQLLLACGMRGEGLDLSPEACAQNRLLNQCAISSGNYRIRCEDFMTSELGSRADIIACSMVIEHWPKELVEAFFLRARELLKPNGRLCIFVPGSPRHWGIEDDVAGHQRRYTFEFFESLAPRAALAVRDLRGLTFPLSNVLLSLSNHLVRRTEGHKLTLAGFDRTLASGVREVPFKTTFPRWVGWIVNPVTLYPFHLLQCLAQRNPDSLVIYCELSRLEKA